VRHGARPFAFVVGVLAVVALVSAGAQPARLTVERLRAQASSANDPAGDAFTGPTAALNDLLDAMAADSSLVGPVQLFLASNTALRLGRVEDAGFFFYAGQVRTAFDFERFDASPRADGNNAATYLGFLRHTIGEQVNPAIMREPAKFAAVVGRLERWNVVPAPTAYYPEFAKAAVKLPRDRWPAAAAALKEQFLTMFARRTLTLLQDREYFEGLLAVQSVTLSTDEKRPIDADDRIKKGFERMAAAEARLFPGERRQTPDTRLPAITPPPPPAAAATPAGADDQPRRVGGAIAAPRQVDRVEPAFPPGRRGSVILEVTIGRDGRVENVHVLRADDGFEAPAVAAVRQWRFEPTVVDGRPVRLLHIVSLTQR
jgi:TonB family protein